MYRRRLSGRTALPNFLRARPLLLWIVIALVAAAVWQAERLVAPITGAPQVVDGDSLRVGGVEIRLFGMDAFEHRQTCSRAGRAWPCGAVATRSLREAIAGRQVACRMRDRDRYGRTVAVCMAGDRDLGAHMVHIGYAVAYGAYEAEERGAREAGRGAWSSDFETPADWRARNPRPVR